MNFFQAEYHDFDYKSQLHYFSMEIYQYKERNKPQKPYKHMSFFNFFIQGRGQRLKYGGTKKSNPLNGRCHEDEFSSSWTIWSFAMSPLKASTS